MAETSPEVVDRIKRDLQQMGVREAARKNRKSHRTVIRIRDGEHASSGRQPVLNRCPGCGGKHHPVQVDGRIVNCLPCHVRGEAA
jgi:hypothetical protein